MAATPGRLGCPGQSCSMLIRTLDKVAIFGGEWGSMDPEVSGRIDACACVGATAPQTKSKGAAAARGWTSVVSPRHLGRSIACSKGRRGLWLSFSFD